MPRIVRLVRQALERVLVGFVVGLRFLLGGLVRFLFMLAAAAETAAAGSLRMGAPDQERDGECCKQQSCDCEFMGLPVETPVNANCLMRP